MLKARTIRTGAALLSLLSISTLISGCWDRREVEEMGFASALAIDKGEKNNVKITVQIPLPAKVGGGGQGGGGGGEGPTFILRVLEGRSLAEAIAKLSTFSDRRVNFTHTKLIVFSKEYIDKSGLKESLEFMTRFREFRRTAWVAIAEKKASDIVSIQPEEEKNPSDYYVGLMNQIKYTGLTTATLLHEVSIQVPLKTPSGAVMPIVLPTTGDQTKANKSSSGGGQTQEPPKDIMVSGLAVINKLKMAGKLNDDESMGYLFMRGHFYGGLIPVMFKKDRVTLAVREASRSIKVLSAEPPYKFLISVDVDADITEVKGPTDLITDKGINQLDKVLAKEIQRRCVASVKKAKDKYRTDIYDLGRRIRETMPLDEWVKLDWSKEFHDSTIVVQTKAHIRRSGNVFQPLESISK